MIDILPDNVLEESFFQYLASVRGDPSQLIHARVALLRVCFHWNAVVIQSKRLWSNIYVAQTRKLDLIPPPNILHTWIERSGEIPLSVYIEYEEKREDGSGTGTVAYFGDNSAVLNVVGGNGDSDNTPSDILTSSSVVINDYETQDEEDRDGGSSGISDDYDRDSSPDNVDDGDGDGDGDQGNNSVNIVQGNKEEDLGEPSLYIDPFSTCINLLSFTVDRWSHFTFKSYTPCDRKWLRPIEMIPFELATQLQDAHFEPSWNMPVPDSVLQKLSALPSLHSLLWWSTSSEFVNTGPNFALLKHLSLAGNSMAYVADVLQIAPTITHLTIRLTTCHCCCDPFEIPSGTRVALPHLEFLSIEAVFDNHKFLDILEAPKLTFLAVKEPIVDMEPFGEEGVSELHPALHRYLSTAPSHLRGIILESQFTANHLIEFFSYPVVENIGVLEIIHHLNRKSLYEENVWDLVRGSAEVSGEVKRRLLFEKYCGKRHDSEVQIAGWAGVNESRAFETISKDMKDIYTFDDRGDRWNRAIF